MQTNKSTAALAFLQSSSLPMLVQEEIERLIMTGELAVGSRINESELSLRFNTSRGPVREALRALEEAGLVRNEKNRGVFVRERIAAYKYPRWIEFVRELPRTATGKIQRFRLRDAGPG